MALTAERAGADGGSRVPRRSADRSLMYILHAGNLYGTERMALATIVGLRDEFQPLLVTPPGTVVDEARRLEVPVAVFRSRFELAACMRRFFAERSDIVVVATGIVHSVIATALNAAYRRRLVHLHVVHGGSDDVHSYGRKKLLNRAGVTFVAVSDFVRDRLRSYGVRADRIRVIENFVPEMQSENSPHRASFSGEPVRRVIVISRLDRVKRVHLLLDALEACPELSALDVKIFGGPGDDYEEIRRRVSRSHPNVQLMGFAADIAEQLARSDLLVHLCPTEPFGLGVIEAMAADVPVLVPDGGGAGAIVQHGVTGYRFRTDDRGDLVRQLQAVVRSTPDQLNRVVANGRRLLLTRFSPAARLDDYRALMTGAGSR